MFRRGNDREFADLNGETRKPPPGTTSTDIWRTNNFDLIRLLAAIQVALVHGIAWFGFYADHRVVLFGLTLFPGVPVFFFVSGLLISRAYLRTTPRTYFRNRALRILPLLWISLIFTLTLVYVNPGCSAPSEAKDWLGWWFTNMTLGQNWPPAFLDGCSLTPLAGGRWTIAVELSFYLLLPLFMWALSTLRRLGVLLLVVLIAASILFQLWVLGAEQLEPMSQSLRYMHASLLSYLWMFLLGVLAHRYFDRIVPWVRNKLLWWVLVYLVVALLAFRVGLNVRNNDITPVTYVVLAGVVLSAATTWPWLSNRVLRRNDFSYGLYLFHIPLLVLAKFLIEPAGYAVFAGWLAVSMLCAVASWFLLERPFLRRKEDSSFTRAAEQATPVPSLGASTP